jgi:hypothetical protein|uniref:Uncharacterized protein n=1 Tax=Mus musculus TaxID=10090 RepID=Q3UN32_MOUSE|nr:unnamed protein product [Mus musculus]
MYESFVLPTPSHFRGLDLILVGVFACCDPLSVILISCMCVDLKSYFLFLL